MANCWQCGILKILRILQDVSSKGWSNWTKTCHTLICVKISEAEDICVSNGKGLIKSEMPVCKLTLAPNKEKNGFAVIFSMCHVVGDEHLTIQF